ncbi:MAG: hypothetical protein DRR19_12550 [Candidatus Parabeggiatoa sp. nov. 1]|nr:MAG: hypothetical protein DRR19_12550 [Gammaproteobacteria bacterium]
MSIEKDEFGEIIAIETNEYQIVRDFTNATISLQGKLRLKSVKEYNPIVEMFDQLIDQEPPVVMLNLRDLRFINSSGINVLSKFLLKVQRKNASQLTVQVSEQYAWQKKVLKSLKRIMPELQLEWDNGA